MYMYLSQVSSSPERDVLEMYQDLPVVVDTTAKGMQVELGMSVIIDGEQDMVTMSILCDSAIK